MTIKAQLADGRILEFPDGTATHVIQNTVRKVVGGGEAPPMEQPVPQAEPVQVEGGEKTDWKKFALGYGPELAGATIGGILGGPIGAGLGGAGVRAWRQNIGRAFGDPDVPQTSEEAAKDILKVGVTEGVGELVGAGIVKAGGKLLAPFAKKVTPKAKEVMKAFKGRIKPVVLTAPEATEHWALDIMQNIAESSIFGGGKLASFKLSRQEGMQQIAEEFIDQFGERISPTQFGEFFTDAVNKKISAHKSVSDILFNKVKSLLPENTIEKIPVAEKVATDLLDSTGNPIVKTVTKEIEQEVIGAPINISPAKEFAQKHKKLLDSLKGLGGENAGEGITNSVVKMDGIVDFDTAQYARSVLLDRIREISIVNKKAKGIRIASELVDLLDSSIENSLVKQGHTEALQAWRTANKFYREGKQAFDNEFSRSLIKKALDSRYGQEAVGDFIFRPHNTQVIKNLKNILPEAQFKKVKSLGVQKIFEKASDPTQEFIVGKKLKNTLSGKPGSFGDDMIKETFSSGELKQLKSFTDALILGQAKQAGGTGSMFIQLKQPGAVVQLAGATLGGVGIGTDSWKTGTAGAVILISPSIFSRMLLNPVTARLLTEGVKMPAWGPWVGGMTTRILHAVYKENKG